MGQCAINKDLGGGGINRLSPVDHTVPRPKQCYLGMGNSSIWHRSPDGLCDITPLTGLKGGGTEIDSESGAESDVSSGTKSIIEGKCDFTRSDLNQLIGEAVVMSYIHYKRHSNQPRLVPALGLVLTDKECNHGEFH